jgi:hypothetical protein
LQGRSLPEVNKGVAVSGHAVVVDGNGQLGVARAGSPLSANELLEQQQLVQELKATTERQAAVIALQEGQIKGPDRRPQAAG